MKKHFLVLSSLVLLVLSTYAQKYAYVSTDYILENIQDYKDAQKQLDMLSVGWQKEIENKYTEIDKMYKSYQAEQILLTEDMKKKREQEIVNKEKEVKDLQKQRFGKDGDLFKKRQELVKPVQDKVYNAVKKLATEGNYAVIFDKSSESVAMLYTNAKFDKSDDVLNLMGIKPGPKTSTTGGGTKPAAPKSGQQQDSKTTPAPDSKGAPAQEGRETPGEQRETRPEPTKIPK